MSSFAWFGWVLAAVVVALAVEASVNFDGDRRNLVFLWVLAGLLIGSLVADSQRRRRSRDGGDG